MNWLEIFLPFLDPIFGGESPPKWFLFILASLWPGDSSLQAWNWSRKTRNKVFGQHMVSLVPFPSAKCGLPLAQAPSKFRGNQKISFCSYFRIQFRGELHPWNNFFYIRSGDIRFLFSTKKEKRNASKNNFISPSRYVSSKKTSFGPSLKFLNHYLFT